MTQILKGFIVTRPFLQPVIARWRSNRILRSVATIASGSVVAQGLSLLSSPVTARLFSPSDYGTAAVFNSAVGLVLLMSTWRYEMAIMLPQDEEDARSVLWCSVALGCAAAVLSAVTLFFFGRGIFGVCKAPQLYRFWWMFPPTILGGSLFQSFSLWTLRRKAYSNLSRSKVSQAITGVSVTLAVRYFCKGPIGLLAGSFCWMSMGVGRLSRGSFWLERGISGAAFWQRTVQALKNYGRFSFLTTVSSLLNSAGTLIAPLLFSACYSQSLVGHFSMAQRVIFLPSTLLGTAVTQVFMAEASDIIRNRPAEMPQFFRKITRHMMPLVACILGAGVLSPWLFPIVFGAPWKMAGNYAAMLSLLAAAQIIVYPISDISILRQRLGLQLGLGAVRATVVASSIWLPSLFGLGPLWAVAIYTGSMSIVTLVAFVFYSRIAHQPCVVAAAPAEVVS